MIAIALSDPEARRHVKLSFAASGIREQKLHFASFMSGSGGELAAAVHARGTSDSALAAAIRSVRDMEFYMPVKAHRESWTGQSAPLVAVALAENEAPLAFDSSGVATYLNREFPPNQPVLVLVPVETDFGRQVALNAQGRRERVCWSSDGESLAQASRRCTPSSGVKASLSYTPLDSSIIGVFASEIAFEHNECGGECWAWGDPEFEMHVHGKRQAADTRLRHIQCVGAGAGSVSKQPIGGIGAASFEYDQNGQSWTGSVQLLAREQLDVVQAVDSSWALTFWEDDSVMCVPTHAWLDPYAVITSAVGAGMAWVGWRGLNRREAGNQAYRESMSLIVGGILSTTALWDLANGGDDYIGLAVAKSTTSHQYASNSRNNVVILNDGGQYRGRATIHYRTTSGIYVGPTATVSLSRAANVTIPNGYALDYDAHAFDDAGASIAGATAVWTSSNPSVATVTQDGFVASTGLGTTVITAVIDGVSASGTVQVDALGAAQSMTIYPGVVALAAAGNTAIVTARTYDSHGWEIPDVDSYTWTSSNPSSCAVSIGSGGSGGGGTPYNTIAAERGKTATLTAHGGWGAHITATAETDEGITLSHTIWCSVNGGNAYSRGVR